MSEALDIYFAEMKFTKLYCKSFGFDVFTEPFQYNFMTFYSPFYISLYHIGQLYSFWYFRNEFLNLVFSLVCWAYGIQGMCFVYAFYSNRKAFWKMHLSFLDVYKRFGNNDVLLEYTKKIKIVTQIITLCLTLNIIAALVYPWINAIFIEKKKVLGFGFLLPFADPKTDIGFYLDFSFQQHCWIFGGIAYVASFRTYYMLIGQLVIKIELLKCMINDLKQVIDDNEQQKQNEKISELLSDIVDFHVRYLQCVDDFETVANCFFFVLASTTTFQVSSILLVLTMETHWYPGYFIIFVGTILLMTICLSGSFAESKHESLATALYDISWYLLSKKHKMVFLYILMSSQNPKPFTFWNLANINVETFLEIYKRIYSGFMLLTNTA